MSINNIFSRRDFLKKTGQTAMAAATAGSLTGCSIYEPTAKAAVKKKIIVEKTEQIYSTEGKELQYNAFTSMDFWRDKYYVVCRQAVHHGIIDGRIILLESSDLKNWTDSVVMDHPSIDDRDPKLMSTPQRLLLYVTLFRTSGGSGVTNTMVSYTEDGIKWSTPQKIYKDGYSLWKPKFHNGLYYVAADISGRAELLKSTDGINWQFVSVISDRYNTTETSLVFLPDNRLLALSRQNKSPGSHWPGFSISSPPYTSWDYTLGNEAYFGGPAAELIGDTIVVASRTYLGNWGLPQEPPRENQRTALYRFNLKTMRLELQAMLPSKQGGDSSYPGILRLGNDRAIMCWYDGAIDCENPNPSEIWLAHIKIVDAD